MRSWGSATGSADSGAGAGNGSRGLRHLRREKTVLDGAFFKKNLECPQKHMLNDVKYIYIYVSLYIYDTIYVYIYIYICIYSIKISTQFNEL